MTDIKRCCLCGRPINNGGKDPSPVIKHNGDKVCCDLCYAKDIVPYLNNYGRGFALYLNIDEMPDGKLCITHYDLSIMVPDID